MDPIDNNINRIFQKLNALELIDSEKLIKKSLNVVYF